MALTETRSPTKLVKRVVSFPMGGAIDVVVAPAEHAHDGVCWRRAPGLNTDVHSTDGDNLLQAIWLKSDTGLVRLSVSLPSDRSGSSPESGFCEIVARLPSYKTYVNGRFRECSSGSWLTATSLKLTSLLLH
jgi:hypothetical protein